MKLKLPLCLPYLALLAACLGTGAAPARAQTGYPMITSVYPVGCQRGKTTEITVSGAQDFSGVYAVMFGAPGLSAEVVAPEKPPAPKQPQNTLTLKVTPGPEAPLGPQEMRVVTPRGVSSLGLLVVGAEPETLEKEPNNVPTAATPFDLPVTLNGRIDGAEDVDCFKFQAQAGDQIVFSCLSARLQDKIHDLSPGGGGTHSDPILILTDETGRELATADDYYGPDPLLVQRFEKAGTYILQIRDVRFQNSPTWTYRLTCTRSAFLTNVYPMAGERGRSVEVTPVGFNLAGMKDSRVQVPMRGPGEMEVQLPAGGGMTNPVPFFASDLSQSLETPDNDSFEKATPAPIPGGWNGRIEKEGDVDCFRFTGAPGQAYTFEVEARRLGSSLDSVIQVLDKTGKPLANNDDALGKDSRLDWTCPAAGEYALQITDLHNRGGEAYVYNIAATPARPDFLVQCDDDKALIGPGSGYAMYVLAQRRNGFAGDIKLAVDGLPPGVTATADRIPANMTQACVVLRAAPDTKPSFARIHMWATGEVKLPDGKMLTVRHEIAPLEEIYLPGGGRGRYEVSTHVASVTEPSDVLIRLSANRVDLKPGGSVTLDVDVVRQKGYDKNVVLDVYLRHLGSKYGDPLPPGVSLDENESKTLLGPTENKGKIVLRASGDAPEVTNLPIAVLGQISINFVVKVSHASEPVLLSVKK